jgi:hypothetical protein
MDADGVIPRNIKAAQAAVASALLASALVAVVGCTARKDGGGCTHTKVAVEAVHLTSQTAPLTLRATATTSSGKPLAAFRLQFFLTFAGPTKLVGRAGKVDDLSGYATTNGAGVATFRLTRGPAGVALPGERGVGYTVRLEFGNPINGQTYCGSSARTTFN